MAGSIMLHWRERLGDNVIDAIEEILYDLEAGNIDEDEAYENLVSTELTSSEAIGAVERVIEEGDDYE